MKKIVILILFSLALTGCGGGNEKKVYYFDKNGNMTTVKPGDAKVLPADKIEVMHFHGTYQCRSCIAIGEYALNTIKKNFSEEYERGIIEFREINGELPENKDLVAKYQARGSSLFINAIAGGQDNIEEDMTVWRLISSEEQFADYFTNKLKQLLNK